jgi:hypothetical protein
VSKKFFPDKGRNFFGGIHLKKGLNKGKSCAPGLLVGKGHPFLLRARHHICIKIHPNADYAFLAEKVQALIPDEPEKRD